MYATLVLQRPEQADQYSAFKHLVIYHRAAIDEDGHHRRTTHKKGTFMGHKTQHKLSLKRL
jgi:hypothetical protein